MLRFVARFFDEDGNVVKTKTLQATSPTKAALEAKMFLDKGANRPAVAGEPLGQVL